jgi:hypothetical protein
LQEFLRLEHGIPSHDTFSRVFRLLDPAAFHGWFLGFMRPVEFAGWYEGMRSGHGVEQSLRRRLPQCLHPPDVARWAIPRDGRSCAMGDLARWAILRDEGPWGAADRSSRRATE